MTSSIWNEKSFEKIWIPSKEISNSKLYATQWFSGEKIKLLLQLYEIWVGSYKESNLKSFGSILKLPSNLELFRFLV